MKQDEKRLTKFVILNSPRTGSNMLCTVLNSHPEILCHHEIFNPHVVGYAQHLQDGPFSIGTIEERERDPVEFLGRVWEADLGHPCVGFKLCWRQHELIFRTVLEDVGIKKIILRRRNRVKSFVSLLLARQTGKWVVYQPHLVGERARVEVDLEALRENIAFNDEYYSEIYDTLRRTGQAHLDTSYEDLFSLAERERILGYLGVSPRAAALMKEGTYKLNPLRVREVVSNFDELDAALRGTELEAELHSEGI